MKFNRLNGTDWDIKITDEYTDTLYYDYGTEDDEGGTHGDLTTMVTLVATKPGQPKPVRMDLIVNHRTGMAKIDWIGGNWTPEGTRDKISLGPANLKQLLLAVKGTIPIIKTFIGDRVSGARKGPLATGNSKPFRLTL